jgi:D-3-phosphoglycerate dehydrogenase / 2-oxoglutarate reductase
MQKSFPKDKIKVVLVEGVHAAGVEVFRGERFQIEALAASPNAEKLRALLKDAHVLGLRSKTQLTKELLQDAPKLLAVGCFCIGTDQVDLASARRQGVAVFNAPFSNTRSVAEMTIAEIIALTRGLFRKSELLHQGVWDKSASGAHEVRGRTLGIVGYGHIGSQVSVLAEALGMRVLYYDIAPKLPLGNARAVRTLAELLKESDVVTLHVPHTTQTQDMMGLKQLRAMKAGSVLINNARGGVVHLPSLVEVLRSEHLHGAALDVFPVEPAGKGESFESPLRGLANVILTPHIGGSTEEAQEAIAVDVAEKLVKFVNVGTTTTSVNVPQVELPEQALQHAEGHEAGDGVDTNRRHRILHFHKNVPGVLSKMHTLIAALGANVAAEYLQTKDDVGYVVLDVDPTDGVKVFEGIKTIPETIRARLLW